MASHTLEPGHIRRDQTDETFVPALLSQWEGFLLLVTAPSFTISHSFRFWLWLLKALRDQGLTWKVGRGVIPISYQGNDLSPSRERVGGEEEMALGEKVIYNFANSEASKEV